MELLGAEFWMVPGQKRCWVMEHGVHRGIASFPWGGFI